MDFMIRIFMNEILYKVATFCGKGLCYLVNRYKREDLFHNLFIIG